MNKLVKDMLMARYGGEDSRSRDYRGGDYAYDRNRSDYTSDYRRRDMQRGDGTYAQPYPDRADRHYEYPQQFEDRRRSDMRSRDYGNDYRSDYRGDYGDYARGDRGETQYGKMSEKDIKTWERNLINSDGTRGGHFKKDDVEHIANKSGIDVHRFGGIDVFAITMNAMYADYCAVAKKFGNDIPEFYACLAKAFLEDKDFKGSGEEKLWLYYKCIAEQEE